MSQRGHDSKKSDERRDPKGAATPVTARTPSEEQLGAQPDPLGSLITPSPTDQRLAPTTSSDASAPPASSNECSRSPSIPFVDDPAVNRAAASLAWGGMWCWSISRLVRLGFPEATHTMGNVLGDFAYTLVAVPVLASMLGKHPLSANRACFLSIAALCVIEGGYLGPWLGAPDLMDIPAGIVGAGLGFILGREGIRPFIRKVVLRGRYPWTRPTTSASDS